MAKEKRGGFRENAKRPLKYGEETVLVGPFRVPVSKKDHIVDLVQGELNKFEIEYRGETIKEFLKRLDKEGKLPTRLRSCYYYGLSDAQRFPQTSILDKLVKDATFDDLYRWRGMGQKTWEEFVKLRGY